MFSMKNYEVFILQSSMASEDEASSEVPPLWESCWITAIPETYRAVLTRNIIFPWGVLKWLVI